MCLRETLELQVTGDQGRRIHPVWRATASAIPSRTNVPAWGLTPEPYLILWPFLASWSVPPMSPAGARPNEESECRSEREPGIPSGGTPPPSSRGSFAPARQSHQSGSSTGWRGWSLAGASRNVAETSTQETKHHTQSLSNKITDKRTSLKSQQDPSEAHGKTGAPQLPFSSRVEYWRARGAGRMCLRETLELQVAGNQGRRIHPVWRAHCLSHSLQDKCEFLHKGRLKPEAQSLRCWAPH
ncbi:PREDICTED: uncharacterized protein LOC104986707 [Bison bison bison]|uniref:Uncharacterized protein LOC104986707 n=1 Tax=Bison bison bison TaxID=43346 RepID=A0A6P3GWJ2_BISBB|nr:PREDICTED: uncharacterized protein LOC104986707 [Bison bison bison]